MLVLSLRAMRSPMLGAGEGDARVDPTERKATTVVMENCILIDGFGLRD